MSLEVIGSGYAKTYVAGHVASGAGLSVINRVTFWYDHHVKSWCVQVLDEEDNQVGESHYVYTRSEAEKLSALVVEGRL